MRRTDKIRLARVEKKASPLRPYGFSDEVRDYLRRLGLAVDAFLAEADTEVYPLPDEGALSPAAQKELRNYWREFAAIPFEHDAELEALDVDGQRQLLRKRFEESRRLHA